MRIRLAFLILLILIVAGVAYGQNPPQGPLTEKDVARELKSSGPDAVIPMVRQRGVDFDLTPEIEKKLRKAKATDQLIEAVKNAGPTARKSLQISGPPAAQGLQVSPEEGQAFGAIRSELDPDKAIALVEDFEKKYPNSPMLSYAYGFAANAYQNKNDVEKIVEYGEKSLKLKPDNIMSLIMMAAMIPQPQYLNKHEMDKDKRLQEAETCAQQALKAIEQLPKMANEGDQDFQKRKAGYAAGVHGSLGMVHLDRSSLGLAGPDRDELAKAEQEYRTAVSSTDRPDPRDYYRLGETYAIDGKLDEAIEVFTKAGELGQGTMIKTYADQRIEDLKKRKAQPAAPPKP